MKFLIRWLITSIAVAVAVMVVPGIEITGNAWIAVTIAALILGLVNATAGTLLRIGTFGCIVLTLGLFTLVINAAMLSLSSWIAQEWFGIGFVVDGFWPAFWGAIVVSIVSGMLTWFVRSDDSGS